LEGDATALQLARLLDVPNLVVSQPAAGLPVGGDVEFADAVTLARAVEGRLTLNN
jgi:recombination protein RecR